MKVAVMQPYFLPYIGYFQLINAVDKFVLLDDVRYANNKWVKRNEIECGRISLRLEVDSQSIYINQLEIKTHWEYLNEVGRCYEKAPYFAQVARLLVGVYASDPRLSEYHARMIRGICQYIGIKTDVIIASKVFEKRNVGAARLVDICNELDADEYVNAEGGHGLYSQDQFGDIELKFLKCKSGNKLSIVDWLAKMSPDEIKKELENYELL